MKHLILLKSNRNRWESSPSPPARQRKECASSLQGSCSGDYKSGDLRADSAHTIMCQWHTSQNNFKSWGWICFNRNYGGATQINWCQNLEVTKLLLTRTRPLKDIWGRSWLFPFLKLLPSSYTLPSHLLNEHPNVLDLSDSSVVQPVMPEPCTPVPPQSALLLHQFTWADEIFSKHFWLSVKTCSSCWLHKHNNVISVGWKCYWLTRTVWNGQIC